MSLSHVFPSDVAPATVTRPFSMAMPIPAPILLVNAWEKRIQLASVVVPPMVSVPVADLKYDGKTDQHDSGIDVNEQLNSAASSTRSSPNNEAKMKTEDILNRVRVEWL